MRKVKMMKSNNTYKNTDKKTNKTNKPTKKWNNSYTKLVLMLCLGAVIGAAGSIVLSFSGEEMASFYSAAIHYLEKTGVFWVGGLVVIITVAGIAIYIHLKRLWRKEEESDDETADMWGEKFDFWSQLGITVANTSSGTILILGFLSMPSRFRNVDLDISTTSGMYHFVLYIALAALLVGGAVLVCILEILIIHLMQKRDPHKQGDPSSFSFNKKWLESCDETEKMVIYQAGYKAYTRIQVMILIAMIATIWGKLWFDTGNFPIVLVGILWIYGTASFGIRKMKGLKNR
ncbi:MAG: DUF3169 family protein [Clostridia bacterium]|nr:DUF3169 family protein [Clostridia bacterium]NCC43028.1 DUF3169 family protein [Clostridia bacterium]